MRLVEFPRKCRFIGVSSSSRSKAIPETTSLGSIVMRLSWEDAAIRHSPPWKPSFFFHSCGCWRHRVTQVQLSHRVQLVRRREGALLELELSVIPSNCQTNSVWILDVTSNLWLWGAYDRWKCNPGLSGGNGLGLSCYPIRAVRWQTEHSFASASLELVRKPM